MHPLKTQILQKLESLKVLPAFKFGVYHPENTKANNLDLVLVFNKSQYLYSIKGDDTPINNYFNDFIDGVLVIKNFYGRKPQKIKEVFRTCNLYLKGHTTVSVEPPPKTKSKKQEKKEHYKQFAVILPPFDEVPEVNLINLTPHPISVIKEKKVLTLPPPKIPARVITSYRDEMVKIKGKFRVKVKGISRHVIGLPDPVEDTFYIVSKITAEALADQRQDLLVINDHCGSDKECKCKSFSRFSNKLEIK